MTPLWWQPRCGAPGMQDDADVMVDAGRTCWAGGLACRRAAGCAQPGARAATGPRALDWRARQVTLQTFDRHDSVIAMNDRHFARLSELFPPGQQNKVRSAAAFSAGVRRDGLLVPYDGREVGFERVLEMVDGIGEALLIELREHRGSSVAAALSGVVVRRVATVHRSHDRAEARFSSVN